jgi:hypothetical protein
LKEAKEKSSLKLKEQVLFKFKWHLNFENKFLTSFSIRKRLTIIWCLVSDKTNIII